VFNFLPLDFYFVVAAYVYFLDICDLTYIIGWCLQSMYICYIFLISILWRGLGILRKELKSTLSCMNEVSVVVCTGCDKIRLESNYRHQKIKH
jgi:hypothetical protein